MYKRIIGIVILLLGGAILIASPTASAVAQIPNMKGVRIHAKKDKTFKIKWNKAKSADGYQIFQYKTKEKKFVKVATVGKNKTAWISKKTKTKKKYKVRAYKKLKGKRINSKFSYEVSAIPYKKNAKLVNAGRIKPNRYNVKLGLYETETLSVKISPSKYAKNKKAKVADKTVRWYSTDTSIVTVDENGKVTPQGKAGECAVYARAHNGNYSGKIWIKVKDFASPKKFYDVEYMQEDMKKLVLEHEDDLKEIAAYFEKNRANQKGTKQMANFWLNDSRTDIESIIWEGVISVEEIKDTMLRVLDSFPGEMIIEINDMAIYFILRDSLTSVDVSYGFYQMKEPEESMFHFKIAPRWYYYYSLPGA